MKKMYKIFLALFLLITLSDCSSKDEELKIMENDEIVNFIDDQYIPFIHNKSTNDELFLTGGDKQKIWIWDTEVQGHFGCGPVTSYSPDGWLVEPNEMESFEMYDDELIFCSNNNYILNAHGYVYVDPSAKEVMGSNERDIDLT